MIYQLPSSLISIFINICLNIMLIPRYGAIGAVISTAISATFSDGILLFYGQKSYPLPFNLKKVFMMFGILIFYTALIYALMLLNISFTLKIIIKIALMIIMVYQLFKKLLISFVKNFIKPFSKDKKTPNLHIPFRQIRVFELYFLKIMNKKIIALIKSSFNKKAVQMMDFLVWNV